MIPFYGKFALNFRILPRDQTHKSQYEKVVKVGKVFTCSSRRRRSVAVPLEPKTKKPSIIPSVYMNHTRNLFQDGTTGEVKENTKEMNKKFDKIKRRISNECIYCR